MISSNSKTICKGRRRFFTAGDFFDTLFAAKIKKGKDRRFSGHQKN